MANPRDSTMTACARPDRRKAAGAIAGGLLLAAAVFHVGRGHLGRSDDGGRALHTAVAVAGDQTRFGLLDYTHHPLLPAYLLVPFIHAGVEPPQLVPLAASALSAGVALGALLALAPYALWPGILATFVALLWQPGYIGWAGDAWQHSWNVSIVLLLVAIATTRVNIGAGLFCLGVFTGWIGYDFLFAQFATLVALRVTFWWQRRGLARRALRVADEATAYLTGIALGYLGHIAQNALYFSSAVIAVDDLLSGAFTRLNNSNYLVLGLADRARTLATLASDYVALFLSPRWSHVPSLVVGPALLLVGAIILLRRSGVRRPSVPRLLCGSALGIGGVVAWWFLAPGHALPHTHLFPRVLLIPLFAMVGVTACAFGNPAPADPPAWRVRPRHVVAVLLLALLPSWSLRPAAQAFDRQFYDHVWATSDCAPRLDMLGGAVIPATAAGAPAPARLKQGMGLVGGVNVWGLGLIEHAWRPPAGTPWTYEVRFDARSRVADVLLRAYNDLLPRGGVDRFTISLVGADPPVTLTEQTPNEVVDVGFLRGYRFRVAPPIEADGLVLTVHQAKLSPIVTDLLAFGAPVR